MLTYKRAPRQAPRRGWRGLTRGKAGSAEHGQGYRNRLSALVGRGLGQGPDWWPPTTGPQPRRHGQQRSR